MMSNNSFSNNTAQYGSNIASIPYKIVEQDTLNDQINISNVPSGLEYEASIKLMLVDKEGQVMNLENEASVKVLTTIPRSRVAGSNSAVFNQGMTEIKGVTFSYDPGASNIQFSISFANSDTHVESMPLIVSFRHCQPGEIFINNQCSK